MRAFIAMFAITTAFACPVQADETPLESRIVSVGLFKNGLAVVKRIVEVPANAEGAYAVADVPEPVHGTFWIESDAEVQTRVTTREMLGPLDVQAGSDFQRELAGRQITIHFRQSGMAALSGRVVELADERGPAWGRNYQPPEYSYWNWSYAGGLDGRQPVHARYLILETDSGRTYVDSSMIASLEVDEPGNTVKRRKSVLVFSVKPAAGAKTSSATIAITYLAKGMSWAPSYRVDISDPQTLRLRQQAVIKNELGDLEDTEIFLISGFPSIEFAHVTSPLSPRTTLAQFFNQLSQQGGLRHFSRGDVVTQQAVMGNDPGPIQGLDLSASPDGEGVDLHYESIGTHTLSEGDSLMVNVAAAQAPYERIIEWIIPDTRDAHGNPIEDYRREQEREKYQDAAWDAVRFRNPLGFPMTTAPAMIVAGERFNGQRTSFWTNVGEETTLQIIKALSIRTRHHEQEEPEQREFVMVGGRKFRQVPVKGELVMNNHRGESITMVIRRRFSGDLIEADASPKSVLLEEGVYSINRRNELVWTLTLKPGEERTLAYRYLVLVPH